MVVRDDDYFLDLICVQQKWSPDEALVSPSYPLVVKQYTPIQVQVKHKAPIQRGRVRSNTSTLDNRAKKNAITSDTIQTLIRDTTRTNTRSAVRNLLQRQKHA